MESLDQYPLSGNDLHIWQIDLTTLPSFLENYWEILAEDEKERADEI